jgi:hypothetical protein
MFNKYDSYKNSGLEWLSDVPSKWNVKRIKDVALLKYSNVIKRSMIIKKIFNYVTILMYIKMNLLQVKLIL